jgi:hypothetical protein
MYAAIEKIKTFNPNQVKDCTNFNKIITTY